MALGLDHSGFDHLHIYKVYIYTERKQLTTTVHILPCTRKIYSIVHLHKYQSFTQSLFLMVKKWHICTNGVWFYHSGVLFRNPKCRTEGALCAQVQFSWEEQKG